MEIILHYIVSLRPPLRCVKKEKRTEEGKGKKKGKTLFLFLMETEYPSSLPLHLSLRVQKQSCPSPTSGTSLRGCSFLSGDSVQLGLVRIIPKTFPGDPIAQWGEAPQWEPPTSFLGYYALDLKLVWPLGRSDEGVYNPHLLPWSRKGVVSS